RVDLDQELEPVDERRRICSRGQRLRAEESLLLEIEEHHDQRAVAGVLHVSPSDVEDHRDRDGVVEEAVVDRITGGIRWTDAEVIEVSGDADEIAARRSAAGGEDADDVEDGVSGAGLGREWDEYRRAENGFRSELLEHASELSSDPRVLRRPRAT